MVQTTGAKLMTSTRLIACCLLAALPSAGLACGGGPPEPADLIALSPHDTIVLAEVVEATYGQLEHPGIRPWTATLKPQRVLRGATAMASFEVRRSGNTAECDFSSIAKIGDRWVFYINHEKGLESVVLEMPLDDALYGDPRVRRRVPRPATSSTDVQSSR
jgi:hypothetical protein